MSEGYALSRREVLTAVILIWFWVPAAPAMGPAWKMVTLPSIHLSGSADHARAVWPGPSTDHVLCHFRKALGSLTQREADIAKLQSTCMNL